jgi:Tetratricopeptide repeat
VAGIYLPEAGTAETLDVSVIKTRKTVEHPDTLACMNNLVFTYLEQGRFGEAEKLSEIPLRHKKVHCYFL